MTAVATRRRVHTLRQRLREDFVRTSSPVTIDEEAGIIRGFKICGLVSENGREYLPDCLKEARPLYEGKPCYLNHRGKNEQRRAEDDLGIWTNVRFVEGQGLFGDLKYEKFHPYTPRLLDRAKRLPENIGFSHDADGDTKVVSGKVVVPKLYEVHSVDLVADPATTNGLFEGNMKKSTAKAILQEAAKPLSKVRREWLSQLVEQDDMAAPMAAEVPAEPEDAISDGFKAALYAVVDKYIAGEMDVASACSQFKDIAKTHGKLTQTAEPEAPAAEPVAEQDDEKKDDEKKECTDPMKKMEAKLAAMERREHVRQLCESIDFKPNKDQLADLEAIDDPARRTRFAKSLKETADLKADQGKTRSRLSGLREQANGKGGNWKERVLNN